jgi:hypothetical protein
MKNGLLKILAASALVGAATLAFAQTTSRTETFAMRFKELQALSANSASSAYAPAPTFRNEPDAPGNPNATLADTFADLQSRVTSVPYRKPYVSAQPADPIEHSSLAESFARLQALSSNSDRYELSGDDRSAMTTIARAPMDGAKATMRQRFERLFHGAEISSETN